MSRYTQAYDRLTMPEDCAQRIEKALKRQMRQQQGQARRQTAIQRPEPRRRPWAAAAALVCLTLSLGTAVLLLGTRPTGTTAPTDAQTTGGPPQTQATAAPTEPADLTQERDREKICLQFQPTVLVSAGDDFWYYTPQDQERWMAAYEEAMAKAYEYPAENIVDSYSSSGIFLRYQDVWWELMTDGSIYDLSNWKIEAQDCGLLREMVMEAADKLGVAEPVRPEQIRGVRSAALNNGRQVTEPDNLTKLESLLSASTPVYGGALVWFTDYLTLELEDGSTVTLALSEEAPVWLSEGTFYRYGWSDTEELYALFEGASEEETIKTVAESFARAYFAGDLEAMEPYLTAQAPREVYQGDGSRVVLENVQIHGEDLESFDGMPVVTVTFLEDHYVYLTMEFAKDEDAWKIAFYGLEG